MQNKDKSIQEGFISAYDQFKIQNGSTNIDQFQNNQKNSKNGFKKKFVPPFKQNTKEKNEINNNEEQQYNKDNINNNKNKYKDLDSNLVEQIEQQILNENLSVQWDDISGLENAKQSIYEAIIWPMLRPEIFTGLRAPPKGLLLFGPPGTGKTLIGKAIASQSKAVFFSISASNLTSKWIGEGEKLVRTLFKLAEYKSPSVIFIDEVDSLLCQRSDSENEASRKIKTEFLVQLDGVSNNNQKRVLFIGATNRPQELDEAVRRRFTKRLYIPLPDQKGRREFIRRLCQNQGNCIEMGEEEIEAIVQRTEGYSGADLKILATEASMMPFRKQIKNTNLNFINLDKTQFQDFIDALKMVRPSVDQEQLMQYISFNNRFGTFSIQ